MKLPETDEKQLVSFYREIRRLPLQKRLHLLGVTSTFALDVSNNYVHYARSDLESTFNKFNLYVDPVTFNELSPHYSSLVLLLLNSFSYDDRVIALLTL